MEPSQQASVLGNESSFIVHLNWSVTVLGTAQLGFFGDPGCFGSQNCWLTEHGQQSLGWDLCLQHPGQCLAQRRSAANLYGLTKYVNRSFWSFCIVPCVEDNGREGPLPALKKFLIFL